MYHNPVLLKATVDGLNMKPNGVYVDATFGGGGHSKEILSRLNEHGRLYAFDQDEDALANAIDDPRFVLINENFRYVFYLVKRKHFLAIKITLRIIHVVMI
jgi:16S rRNA (cytosine1402-N4)-methyltransferase